MRELKPCPFCGKTDGVVFESSNILGEYGFFSTPPRIGCSHCEYTVQGKTCVINGDSAQSEAFSNDLLINWWNRRNGKDEK